MASLDSIFLFGRGDRIGGYTVRYKYLWGNYYESYIAADGDGVPRFLKLIRTEDLEPAQYDPEGRVIEALTAPAFQHRNTCRFIRSFPLEKDGHRLLCLVMEYAGLRRLCDFMNKGKPMTVRELVQAMEALLSALDSLEQGRGIIHNAVTPGNIMLDHSGDFSRIRLTGLRLARFADLGPDPLSWQRQYLYSVAPERLEGGGSFSSDVFSAGVLMYQLIFGTEPWHEADIGDMPLSEQVRTVTALRRKPLPIPGRRLIDADDAMLSVMAKALEPDCARRFGTAGEFLSALRETIPAGADPYDEADEPDAPAQVTHEEMGALLFCEALSEKTDLPAPGPQQKPSEAGTKAAAEGSRPAAEKKKGGGFADVAGMEDIKSMMREKIIDVLKEPELADKYRIQIPNGMLLYGPPGCGKSFIAEKFAEEAGWNYKFVKSSDLASTYIHGSQEKIGKLFDEARKNAPMILNFDEFDALVPDRGSPQGAHMAGEVNEFLSQMNSCGKDRVFVIASSNRPDLIDPAVRRKGRLDQMIYIPVPDAAAREGMFRVQMKGRPQEEGIDFGHLASLTENYVAADIAFIVNDAAERAFRSRTDITERMLEDAIGRTRPSVGPDDIRYYESLRDKIEKSAKESAHNPIGFIQK